MIPIHVELSDRRIHFLMKSSETVGSHAMWLCEDAYVQEYRVS